MSARADISASTFGIASGTRSASLDVTGCFGSRVAVGGRHGSCLWYLIMSGAVRHRDGWLAVVALAAFFVIALGGGAAWPAVGGGHGVGHPGGFAGGGPRGEGLPRGREFGNGPFDGRPRVHGGPRVFAFPYFYDPYYGYDPYYPGYPYDAYCDAYSPYYDPQDCYWDDGP